MKDKIEQALRKCLEENGYLARIVWIEDATKELEKEGVVTYDGNLQLRFEKNEKNSQTQN